MALGSDPTNWQSWPQGMNKTLTGVNITVIVVQWALFCVLPDSLEQVLGINEQQQEVFSLPASLEPSFPFTWGLPSTHASK